MTGSREEPLIAKFAGILDLSDEERRLLGAMSGPLRTASPRRDVVVEGRPIPFLAIVQDGWLFAYKRRSDGRRTILGFLLPGDFVGLHRRVLPIGRHSVHSATLARLVTIPDGQMSALMHDHPRFADAMFFLSACQASMLAEHAVRLARLSARERLAHLLLELHARLAAAGKTSGDSFFFPLTQEMLADALGLSVMHIHRMLHGLQNDGLIKLGDHRMTLRDRQALNAIAEFDPAYLRPEVRRSG